MTNSRFTLGVVATRRVSTNKWAPPVSWAPSAVMPLAPPTAPMTRLTPEGAQETWYVGPAELTLHPGETAHYRDNLQSGRPSLWVALREAGDGVSIAVVTADPYEGEALAGDAGLILEAVPMPAEIASAIGAFYEAFHVEREFFKRKRKKADPEALARRAPRVLDLPDDDEEDGR